MTTLPADAPAGVRVITLDAPDDFAGWRTHARALIAADIAPDTVQWQVAGETRSLFAAAEGVPLPPGTDAARLAVPRAFLSLARTAALHRDAERFALLYALLHRLTRGQARLDDRADPLVARVAALARAVRRDMHKMHAFVRFRAVAEEEDEPPRYVAWFEPEHHIVRACAGFFVDRFAGMRWSILTPELSLHWDGAALREGPGATRADAPAGDPVEETWKRYYASIFNPARVKMGAMLKEMPRKYWANMPETALIPALIAEAQPRAARMIANAPAPAAPIATAPDDWRTLSGELLGCTRCPLAGPATQVVPGEGPRDAALMLVGEQPGDQEDLTGRPFVGPAGEVLDAALAEAGIDRAAVYLTNAVKHFRFELRGKRRLHQTPSPAEITACRWWVQREIALVRPRLIVALGATAARSLFGRAVPVGASRGQALMLADGTAARVTIHPSYLLRLPDRERAAEEQAAFVRDLAEAQRALAAG
jgi:DNA polymerase